jgi:hypothetical protein
MNDNETGRIWALTLGIGLPVSAVVAKLLWCRARQSVWWRLVVCVVIACAISPSVVVAFAGGFGGGVFFPAVLLAVGLLVSGDIFAAIILGAFPICIVSLLLLGVWSAFRWMKAKP